jgi:hypothetical protein
MASAGNAAASSTTNDAAASDDEDPFYNSMLKSYVSKPRQARPTELYAHRFWDDRIEKTFRDVVKTKYGGEAHINAVKEAINICWAAESDKFKAEIKEELKKLYEEKLREWDGLVNKVDGIAINPEERQRYVDRFLVLSECLLNLS